MSSFLCFVCHSTVNADTNEDTREKYREVIGMHLCPDSHLCFICCYFLNKMCLFKSICLKRSLEYPVLFSEKGTINLQRSDLTVAILCPEDICLQHINTRYHFYNNSDNSQSDFDESNYCELQDERNFDINDSLLKTDQNEGFHSEDFLFSTKDNIEDSLFNEELCLPNLEPVRITQNDLVNGEWTKNDVRKKRNDTILLELETCRSNANFEENVINECTESQKIEGNLNLTIDQNVCESIPLINNMKENEEHFIQNIKNDIIQNIATDSSLEKNIENEMCENLEIDEPININSEEDTTTIVEIENSLESKYTNSDHDDLLESSKSPKRRKKDFKKIKLSVKEQKMELEQGRRDEKYIAAGFKCYNCGIYFHFKDSYQAHMMRHEESNGEYCCSICSLRFANPAVLRSHAANHAERYRCTRCRTVVRARQRQTHLRACTGKGTVPSVTCHLCGNVFHTASHFQQHLKRFHQSKSSNRSYLCNVCGASFNNRAAVRTHMITHINRTFSCDQCPATFSSPYTLNQHKKKHSNIEQELHFCPTCKVGFSTRKSLLAHRRNTLAHKDTVYKCPVCSRTCPSVRSLRSHTATVHARTNHLVCALCQATYSTRKALTRHMACHKSDLPKKMPLCHSCGETFKSTSIFKKHLKNVCEKDKTDEIPYYE